jgi:hypothetical protein
MTYVEVTDTSNERAALSALSPCLKESHNTQFNKAFIDFATGSLGAG